MTDINLEKNITYQAEMKADWAIAYALLQIANMLQELVIAIKETKYTSDC